MSSLGPDAFSTVVEGATLSSAALHAATEQARIGRASAKNPRFMGVLRVDAVADCEAVETAGVRADGRSQPPRHALGAQNGRGRPRHDMRRATKVQWVFPASPSLAADAGVR